MCVWGGGGQPAEETYITTNHGRVHSGTGAGDTVDEGAGRGMGGSCRTAALPVYSCSKPLGQGTLAPLSLICILEDGDNDMFM